MSHILVVEDDRDIADLIRHYLANAGHRAAAVASGDEALACIDEQPPDVLIVDLMLPGMSGLDVCRALRGDQATPRLPIIMVTARAQEQDRIFGLDSGAERLSEIGR